MHNSTSRRQFLGATAAAAATAALGRSAYGAAENRTLRLGLIGAGWYGMVDSRRSPESGRRRNRGRGRRR